VYVVKCMTVEKFKDGYTVWNEKVGSVRREFPTEKAAWSWAEDRSKSGHGATSIYQVFHIASGKKSGFPYVAGEIYRDQSGHTYVLQFRDLTPGALWKWFDTDDKVGKEYTLEAARKRCSSCYFSGKHRVRITRQSDPVEYVYHATPTQAELEAWINSYNPSSAGPITTQGQESEMHLSKPLNIPTKTMAEKIQTFLDAKQDEWDEKLALANEKNAQRIEIFNSLVAAEPARLLTYFRQGNGSSLAQYIDDVIEGRETQEGLLKKISTWAEFVELGAQPRYEEAEKVLSVLKATSDETIEVSTDSDLYRYL